MSANVFVKTFPVGPLQCNCTIVGDLISKQALVVDPGGDADVILNELTAQGLSVSRITHTHAHFDHFLASGVMHEQTGASLCLHPSDKPLWLHLEMQCQLYNIPYMPVPEPHQWLEHEEDLHVSQIKGKALHTPGHTPGSMSFWFEDLKLLLAGDTLFKGSIGRTDLWGGDFSDLERSIQTELYTLDEMTTVVTGHGPSTTVGYEIQHNPYVKPISLKK